MTKHTPGPWTVAKATRYVHHADMLDANGFGIASIWGRAETEAAAANARLIAAAPQMLAVLRAIRCTLPGLDGDKGNLFDRVSEAIEEAEGK